MSTQSVTKRARRSFGYRFAAACLRGKKHPRSLLRRLAGLAGPSKASPACAINATASTPKLPAEIIERILLLATSSSNDDLSGAYHRTLLLLRLRRTSRWLHTWAEEHLFTGEVVVDNRRGLPALTTLLETRRYRIAEVSKLVVALRSGADYDRTHAALKRLLLCCTGLVDLRVIGTNQQKRGCFDLGVLKGLPELRKLECRNVDIYSGSSSTSNASANARRPPSSSALPIRTLKLSSSTLWGDLTCLANVEHLSIYSSDFYDCESRAFAPRLKFLDVRSGKGHWGWLEDYLDLDEESQIEAVGVPIGDGGSIDSIPSTTRIIRLTSANTAGEDDLWRGLEHVAIRLSDPYDPLRSSLQKLSISSGAERLLKRKMVKESWEWMKELAQEHNIQVICEWEDKLSGVDRQRQMDEKWWEFGQSL